MMNRVYAVLLRLYPGGHQAAFSAEMLATFEEAARDHRERGGFAFASFILAEIIGLLAVAATAWVAAWREVPALNLTKMRPPGVSCEAYGEALDEVIAARRLVESNLVRMQTAIYHREFARARFYSDEDRKAREKLRLVRRKYGIAD